MLVNTAPQPRHCRRRQIVFVRFCARLLATRVPELQYRQTMSTYCHSGDKNASGKPVEICGKQKLQIVANLELISLAWRVAVRLQGLDERVVYDCLRA